MINRGPLIRVAAAAAAALFVVAGSASSPRAQGIPAVDRRITYIMPQWLRFLDGDVAQQAALLRAKIGEGPRVKVGFTTYIRVSMSPVDPTDAAAVQAALAGTFAQMDAAIERAQRVTPPIPICLSFITAIREGKDALQIAAQAEDRRNMQWHQDHSLADGWTTYSRYARRQEAIQEAYVRELGKALASRMALHPDILVAASGDGEIELSSNQAARVPMGIADYSPFAVAEFRDWLRGRGLYAPGQAFAGEAYANSARYANDASLALLNGDFGLSGTAREISTWDLKFFDWSLSDPIESDPHAMPQAQFPADAFDPVPDHPGGFDPPRLHQRGDAWSDLWDLFRATMVWRHNREFAKWINESGVPADRWFTDQIPADYLFGGTPENPNGRLDSSASPIFTADVSPYGSLGITSFNVNFESVNGSFARTLAGAAPAIAARRVRWGVFEWNPSVGPSANPAIYTQEMALVEQYRPSVLAPFLWNAAAEGPGDIQGYLIEGTNFETALRDLVTRLNNVPLTLSRTSLDIGAIATGAARTPAQTVRVSGLPGETPAWSITSAPGYLDVTPSADGRTFSVALKAGSYAPGTSTGAIVVTPAEPGYAAATLTVTLRVTLPGASAAPGGVVDLPANDAIVSGEVAVTGWAVDDIGLAKVSIYRRPVAPETDLVFVGDATFVPNARPDVQGAFPGTPQNDQAGWGYMLLSNMLPNGGNGTFTLVVRAEDVEGHAAIIGERRIVGRNSEATVPFGTIDTPRQGETVSGGQYINFGWALTPGAFMIPPDGSTITVLIDNIAVGHPTYGFARADIDALFPGYSNSGGAVGFYIIDTTALTNGLHTIAWIVRDNGNRIQGIGSRFFTVANP